VFEAVVRRLGCRRLQRVRLKTERVVVIGKYVGLVPVARAWRRPPPPRTERRRAPTAAGHVIVDRVDDDPHCFGRSTPGVEVVSQLASSGMPSLMCIAGVRIRAIASLIPPIIWAPARGGLITIPGDHDECLGDPGASHALRPLRFTVPAGSRSPPARLPRLVLEVQPDALRDAIGQRPSPVADLDGLLHAAWPSWRRNSRRNCTGSLPILSAQSVDHQLLRVTTFGEKMCACSQCLNFSGTS